MQRVALGHTPAWPAGARGLDQPDAYGPGAPPGMPDRKPRHLKRPPGGRANPAHRADQPPLQGMTQLARIHVRTKSRPV